MILLDRRRYDAGHTDAVTAHGHVARHALRVEHRGVHRFAVLGAELKYLPDLDPASHGQRCSGRAGVAVDGIAQVCDLRERDIAIPVDAGEVVTLAIGATDEVGHGGNGLVDNDRNAQVDRAE